MTYHRCRASLPLLMCACSLLEAHPSRATSSGASLDTICNSSSSRTDGQGVSGTTEWERAAFNKQLHKDV